MKSNLTRPYNIFNNPEIKLSGFKKTRGHEGHGAEFTLKIDNKPVCKYVDYADGAGAEISVDDDEKAAMKALLAKLIEQADTIIGPAADDSAWSKQWDEKTIEALRTGKDVTYEEVEHSGSRYQPGDKRTITLREARNRLVESWLCDQMDIQEELKMCKTSIAFHAPGQAYQVSTIKLPFTAENRQYVIDKYFDGDASKVVIINDKYSDPIELTPIEMFNANYGKKLAALQSGKELVFRVKDGVNDGTLDGGWRMIKPTSLRTHGVEAARKDLLRRHDPQGEGKVEYMLDVLLAMRDEAIASSTSSLPTH